jgi:hypothetical protein
MAFFDSITFEREANDDATLVAAVTKQMLCAILYNNCKLRLQPEEIQLCGISTDSINELGLYTIRIEGVPDIKLWVVPTA